MILLLSRYQDGEAAGGQEPQQQQEVVVKASELLEGLVSSPVFWVGIAAWVAVIIVPAFLEKHFLRRQLAELDRPTKALILLFYLFASLVAVLFPVLSLQGKELVARIDLAQGIGSIDVNSGGVEPLIIAALATVVFAVCITVIAFARSKHSLGRYSFDAEVEKTRIVHGSAALPTVSRSMRNTDPQLRNEALKRLRDDPRYNPVVSEEEEEFLDGEEK